MATYPLRLTDVQIAAETMQKWFEIIRPSPGVRLPSSMLHYCIPKSRSSSRRSTNNDHAIVIYPNGSEQRFHNNYDSNPNSTSSWALAPVSASVTILPYRQIHLTPKISMSTLVISPLNTASLALQIWVTTVENGQRYIFNICWSGEKV